MLPANRGEPVVGKVLASLRERHGFPRGTLPRRNRTASAGAKMFAYLLKIVQDFERRHGHRPQVICLNPEHMQQFMAECPDLFHPDTAMPLGFRILILPESELPHPKPMWLPKRRRTLPRAPCEEDLKLLAWTKTKRRRREL